MSRSSREADIRTSNALAVPLAEALSDPEIQALFDACADMSSEGRMGPDYQDDPAFDIWLAEEEATHGPLSPEERERAERFWMEI